MQSSLDQWLAALPAHRVRSSAAELQAARACTFAWPRRITAILVPENTAQVPAAAGPAERAVLEPGNPTGQNVLSAYWRKKTELPALEDTDPDRDRCGVIWACPSLPLDGPVVAPVIAEMERRIRAHGLEPNIGLNPVSSRLFECYAALMFDRDVAGEDKRAMACHDALMRWLISQGHLPYRLGIQSFGMLPQPVDDSGAVLRRIKRAFDPHGVVAPGRYAA